MNLLEVEPDLGEGLSADELAEADRHARCPVVGLSPGPWASSELHDVAGVAGRACGFLVLEGLVAMRIWMHDRTSARPAFPGELVLLDGSPSELIPLRWEWTAFEHSRLAILDQRLWTMARHWPALGNALLERAGLTARRAQLDQTISQLARVEDRLLAFLWSVADRRGVIRPDGVMVPIQLTHEVLAEIIGARRPTVSLGLTRLGADGVLKNLPGGFLLRRDSLSHFDIPDPDNDAAAVRD